MNLNLYADGIVSTIRESLIVLDADLRVKTANPAFYRTFKLPSGAAAGRLIYELGNGQWNIPVLRKMLEEIIPNNGEFEEFFVDQEFPIVGRKNLVFSARRLHDGDEKAQLILLAIEDLTARRQAEAELAYQRTWLGVTLSSIGDAVIATDISSNISFMNPTAEKLTGWSAQEASGHPLSEVFNIVNEETRQIVESPVTKAIRQGQIVGLANHTILIMKDKFERHIDDSAAPIRDARGNIIGVVLVFRDIGDRRAAEKRIEVSEARYRRLFEAAFDGILILDAPSDKILEVNRFLLDLLHQPREYFIGKQLWELGVFQDIDASKAAFKELKSKGYVHYENLPLQDRDGRRISVEFVSNVYSEEERQVIQCNIRDIRNRKELEGQHAALLAQEHAARVEAQAAERANRAKDVFLATLSHEMRTPLSAILGWTSILSGENVSEADMKEGIAVIARNAKAQAQLIEDVLDVSRIVSDKLRLDIKPCDLRMAVAAALETMRHEATKKNIKIEIDFEATPLHVSCDVTRIQQVVWNLLSNAIKFTPAGGNIVVSLGIEQSRARIQITDTGQGIAPEFVPYIFDRFRQADSGSKRKFGGLGLGLSIVKHLIELHGGTVQVESKGTGQGATFTVYLPLRAVQAGSDSEDQPANPSPADKSASNIKGLRILVVDDEADSRRLLVKILTDAGAIATAAGSATEGIAAIMSTRPDILISDLGMSDIDGFEFIQQVRKAGFTTTDLPAVALSAFAHKDDQRKALLAGFQIHIGKPIDAADLLTIIAALAGRTKSSSQ